MNLPTKYVALTLMHNEHKLYYESPQSWLERNDWCDFENDDAKARAIASNNIWALQWYPHTPVGFEGVAAPTLEELLAFANRVAAQHE